MRHTFIVALALLFFSACSPSTPAPKAPSKPAEPITEKPEVQIFPPPLQLAQQRNCLACHTMNNKIVGPSWRAISEKYKGQDVRSILIDKVQKGGQGSFGAVAMPANASKISVDETAYLVDWLLKGAPTE
jgi:cytochrome c